VRVGRRIALVLATLLGCRMSGGDDPAATGSEPFDAARERMVVEQLERRGIADARVLAAMRRVPRHELVPEREREFAYEDRPLPIGRGQTISQPYVVAAMTEAVAVSKGDKVLEVGTGSGYQAAVLAELGVSVYTIELEPELAERARADLARLGYQNVHVRAGDGYRGWPEQAPFDAIVVTAAPDHVPPALVEQLAAGGRMVLPVGTWDQDLLRIHKDADGNVKREVLMGVRFVPMRGEAEEGER
jgi:protein-L-isoaspartate(D-aspartate) O-methyltransferase